MSAAKNQDAVVVYGADWCSDCRRVKFLLERNGVVFEYKDIESDQAILDEMLQLTDRKNEIPTVAFKGKIVQVPSNAALMDLLEIKKPAIETHDVVMIGAGPAALSAAIYTTREDIDTVLFEKGVIGGLAAITDWVDNYPGFAKGIAGLDLADNLREQAERFGADIRLGEVSEIIDEGAYKRLVTTDGDMYAKAVLIATGSEYKKMDVPGEAEYYARGVHYCATCDGAFYRDKRLIVVGGGNSAVQEAIFLTRFATHIDMLVRGSRLRASEVLQHELKNHQDKITVHYDVPIQEVIGTDQHVTGVNALDKKTGKQVEFKTDGVFVFIGLLPNTGFLANSAVELDERGLVKTNSRLETTVKGVFAAGDVRSGATMQIASATGEGATSALMMREYLEGHGQ